MMLINYILDSNVQKNGLNNDTWCLFKRINYVIYWGDESAFALRKSRRLKYKTFCQGLTTVKNRITKRKLL